MSNKLLSGALVVLAALAVAPGETLYNGIRLPFEWPPKRVLTRKPMSVPYLDERSQVIPIDIGSQDRIVRVILHFVKAPLERRGLDQEVIYEKLPADMP